jgi:hypothetical protein
MTKARLIACIAAAPVAYLGLCLGIELVTWARIGFDLAARRGCR